MAFRSTSISPPIPPSPGRSTLPGVLTYAGSREVAVAKAKALVFRVLADRLEHGEIIRD